jgi:hypothetical protein
MANLTFPSNPSNGQKFTSNGKVFEYNSTTQRWSVTRAQLLGSLPDDVTIDAPTLGVSLSTVALDAVGANVHVTYTVDQDVDASLSVTGIEDTTATLYKSNNTIVVTAGATEFSGGQINLVVSNGRNTDTEVINVSVAFPIDWTNLAYGALLGGGTDYTYFGYKLGVSTDGTRQIASRKQYSSNVAKVSIMGSPSAVLEDGNNTHFGRGGCDIDGNYAVVGEHDGNTTGGFWIYKTDGSTWTLVHSDLSLPVSDVAVYGDTVAVLGYSGERTCRIYKTSDNGDTWTLSQTIGTGTNGSGNSDFGAVDLHGNTLAIVSGYSHSAQILMRTDSSSNFGNAQAIDDARWNAIGEPMCVSVDDGKTVVFGSEREDVIGSPQDHGRVYIFEWDGSQWTKTIDFKNSDGHSGGTAGDKFGSSVAVQGNNLVVGAPQWDYVESGQNRTNAGAIYVYQKTNGTWTEVNRFQVINNPYSASVNTSYAYFGRQVGIADNNIYVTSEGGAAFNSRGFLRRLTA